MKGWQNKNHYELLGVSKEAKKEEIKQAYKEIALVYHPDSNFFDEIIDSSLQKEQLDIFKAITAAYTTLINPDRRAEYDDTLPPDLPTWNRESGDPLEEKFYSAASQAMTNPNRSSMAFGRFGVVQEPDPSEEEEEAHYQSSFDRAEVRNDLRSQSDAYFQKGGILKRLLRLFGLG